MQENVEEPVKEDKGGSNKTESDREQRDIARRILEGCEKNRNSQESRDNVTIIQCLNYLEKNDGMVIGDTDSIGNIDFSGAAAKDVGKKQRASAGEIFHDRDVLVEWCAEHYHKYSLAFLTAGAVFEKTPYSWVCDCAKELYQHIRREDEASEEIMSKSRLLAQCSMETYLGNIINETGYMPVEFVRMKNQENCEDVLECVCTEFSELRDNVIKWLYAYVFSENRNKSSKAIRAIARMARYDFEYFKNHVLPSLQKEKKLLADYAIAQMLAEISEDVRYVDNVKNSLKHWGTMEGNIHLKMTALLGYAKMRMPEKEMKPAFSYYFRSAISRLETEDDTFLEQLPTIYVLGNRYGAYYRAMVDVLYDITRQKVKEEAAELLYFGLVAEDYMNFVRSREKEDMIFVKLCRYQNETAEKCRYLWRNIWKNSASRGSVKAILIDYLKRKRMNTPEMAEGMLCLILGKEKIPEIKRLQQDICRRKESCRVQKGEKDGRI